MNDRPPLVLSNILSQCQPAKPRVGQPGYVTEAYRVEKRTAYDVHHEGAIIGTFPTEQEAERWIAAKIEADNAARYAERTAAKKEVARAAKPVKPASRMPGPALTKEQAALMRLKELG